jgi:hypothetical protein
MHTANSSQGQVFDFCNEFGPHPMHAWTEDNLLRQVVYEGLREDKPAADVRRAVPYLKPSEPTRPASRGKRSRPG